MLSADPAIERVVGVDVVAPTHDLGGAGFVRTDVRDPAIAAVMERERTDTVVHAGVLATPRSVGGRVSMKEINIIGTMQLLAACQRSDVVRRLVVKSTTAVYGSSPRDPAVFTEDMTARSAPRSGYAKDAVEVEAYVRGFARRRPDIAVTTLRFANFMGPRVTTPMTAYFELPVAPTPLGFDGRLQFIHEDDGLEVMRLATVGDHPGTFNAAGDGLLTLSQALRIAGRPSVPLPTVSSTLVGQLFRRFGLVDFSGEQARFLAHGRVVDCTRLHHELGYRPKHSTPEAFAEFVRERCVDAPLRRERIVAAEAAIRDRLHGGRDA